VRPAAHRTAPRARPRVLSWGISRAEAVLIERIVDRYVTEVPETTIEDQQTITMDLIACHKNAVPLNLERMADWKRFFDIAHDIHGINRHLDRRTGKLLNCFVPRFADTTRTVAP
jgi:hypothetical protein